MRRSLLRAVARGLIGVLLTAQMAIAAYACPANLAASSQAAARDGPGDAPVGMPMAVGGHCDDMSGSMDPAAPNLCAEHCKHGQQIDHAATPNVPGAVLAALYVTPLAPETVAPPRPAPATLSALVAAAPPHAILHCVYRI